MGEMFTNYTSDKKLISKIYKEIQQLNSKSNTWLKIYTKDMNRQFSKEDGQMTNKHMKKLLNITNHWKNANLPL